MLTDWYIRRQLRKNPPTSGGQIDDPEMVAVLAETKQVIVPSARLLYAGKPLVRQFFAMQDQTLATKHRVLQLAASLAKGSQLDVLQAVVKAAKDAGQTAREMETDQLSDVGVIGKLDRTWYLLGDEHCMQQEQIELGVTVQTLAQQFEFDGKYTLFLAQKTPKRLLGIFACEYELDRGVVDSLTQLQQKGLDVVLLTGTKTRIARGVASQAGITLVHSELDEDEKKRIVSALYKQEPRSLILSDVHNRYEAPAHCVMVGENGRASVDRIEQLPALLTYAQTVYARAKKLF